MPLILVKMRVFANGLPPDLGSLGLSHERHGFMKSTPTLHRKWGAFIDESNLATLKTTVNTEMVANSNGSDPH